VESHRRPAPVYTSRGTVDSEDWQGVADAVNERMAALRIGQQELAEASGVSVSTLRKVQHGSTGRRVQNPTLAAIARALDWPDDYLIRLVAGRGTPTPAAGTTEQQILAVLLRMEQRLAEISDCVGPSRLAAAAPAHGDGPDPTAG
jgi:transcriptional regulator with XRE-family HTH domain